MALLTDKADSKGTSDTKLRGRRSHLSNLNPIPVVPFGGKARDERSNDTSRPIQCPNYNNLNNYL